MSIAYINISTMSRGPLPVHVVQVESPALIWVQLRYNRKAIMELQEELEWYLRKKKRQYTIFSDGLRENQDVAVKNNYEWCRGKITLVTDSIATVHLGDWGRSIRKNIRELYQLPEQFKDLLWQALLCGLQGVKPVGIARVWPNKTRAITRLLAEDEDAWMLIKRNLSSRIIEIELRMTRTNRQGPTSLKEELLNLGQIEMATQDAERAYPSI